MAIESKDNQYQSNLKGPVIDKNQAEEELVEVILAVSNALFIIGKRSNNGKLSSEYKVTVSALKQMRDSDLLQKAQRTIEDALQYKEDLQNFAIAEAELEELSQKTKTYKTQLETVQNKAADSQAARRALAVNFDRADELLYDELDKND